MAMEKLSLEVVRTEKAEPFQLNIVEFLLCLREARRGAGFGPSGVIYDHLFPKVKSILVCSVRWDLCSRLGTFDQLF